MVMVKNISIIIVCHGCNRDPSAFHVNFVSIVISSNLIIGTGRFSSYSATNLTSLIFLSLRQE